MYLYCFFNLGARWGWVVNATPRPLYPQERPGAHCIGVWVGPRAGPGECGKYCYYYYYSYCCYYCYYYYSYC